MTDGDVLGELTRTLRAIERLVDRGRDAYNGNELLRWSVQRLWIFAGNSAQVYAEQGGIARSTWPWPDLIGFACRHRALDP